MADIANQRNAAADIDPVFIHRWSPRAFSDKPVRENRLQSLFEAARWSPSCFNEQPWLFLYAATEADLAIYRSILTAQNQLWAGRVPVLAFLLAKKQFSQNTKPNDWAEFDCGAAWMSLAIQANKLGLSTHAMAGFDPEKAHDVLHIPREQYRVMAAIAIGYRGEASQLPSTLLEREIPSQRKPLAQVALQGLFHDFSDPTPSS